MFVKLYYRVKLHFLPPKVGDIYYGHPYDFVAKSGLEQVLHGLKNKNGDFIYKPIPSNDCYRITILSCSMLPLYYLYKGEVLCYSEVNVKLLTDENMWKERIQSRRLSPGRLKEMISDGTLRKEKR